MSQSIKKNFFLEKDRKSLRNSKGLGVIKTTEREKNHSLIGNTKRLSKNYLSGINSNNQNKLENVKRTGKIQSERKTVSFRNEKNGIKKEMPPKIETRKKPAPKSPQVPVGKPRPLRSIRDKSNSPKPKAPSRTYRPKTISFKNIGEKNLKNDLRKNLKSIDKKNPSLKRDMKISPDNDFRKKAEELKKRRENKIQNDIGSAEKKSSTVKQLKKKEVREKVLKEKQRLIMEEEKKKKEQEKTKTELQLRVKRLEMLKKNSEEEQKDEKGKKKEENIRKKPPPPKLKPPKPPKIPKSLRNNSPNIKEKKMNKLATDGKKNEFERKMEERKKKHTEREKKIDKLRNRTKNIKKPGKPSPEKKNSQITELAEKRRRERENEREKLKREKELEKKKEEELQKKREEKEKQEKILEKKKEQEEEKKESLRKRLELMEKRKIERKERLKKKKEQREKREEEIESKKQGLENTIAMPALEISRMSGLVGGTPSFSDESLGVSPLDVESVGTTIENLISEETNEVVKNSIVNIMKMTEELTDILSTDVLSEEKEEKKSDEKQKLVDSLNNIEDEDSYYEYSVDYEEEQPNEEVKSEILTEEEIRSKKEEMKLRNEKKEEEERREIEKKREEEEREKLEKKREEERRKLEKLREEEEKKKSEQKKEKKHQRRYTIEMLEDDLEIISQAKKEEEERILKEKNNTLFSSNQVKKVPKSFTPKVVDKYRKPPTIPKTFSTSKRPKKEETYKEDVEFVSDSKNEIADEKLFAEEYRKKLHSFRQKSKVEEEFDLNGVLPKKTEKNKNAAIQSLLNNQSKSNQEIIPKKKKKKKKTNLFGRVTRALGFVSNDDKSKTQISHYVEQMNQSSRMEKSQNKKIQKSESQSSISSSPGDNYAENDLKADFENLREAKTLGELRVIGGADKKRNLMSNIEKIRRESVTKVNYRKSMNLLEHSRELFKEFERFSIQEKQLLNNLSEIQNKIAKEKNDAKKAELSKMKHLEYEKYTSLKQIVDNIDNQIDDSTESAMLLIGSDEKKIVNSQENEIHVMDLPFKNYISKEYPVLVCKYKNKILRKNSRILKVELFKKTISAIKMDGLEKKISAVYKIEDITGLNEKERSVILKHCNFDKPITIVFGSVLEKIKFCESYYLMKGNEIFYSPSLFNLVGNKSDECNLKVIGNLEGEKLEIKLYKYPRKEIKIFCCTWNVRDRKVHMPTFQKYFLPKNEDLDIIVIGLQQTPLGLNFPNLILPLLGNNYLLVESVAMTDVQMHMFMKKDLFKATKNLEFSTKKINFSKMKSKLGGKIKGAVYLSVDIHGSNYLFINCKLAEEVSTMFMKQSTIDYLNSKVLEILKHKFLNSNRADIASFEKVIFMGNLNYKINEIFTGDINDIDNFLKKDSFSIERKKGLMNSFIEPKITFIPKVFNTYNMVSYPNRILYFTPDSNDMSLICENYSYRENIKSSQDIPVAAQLSSLNLLVYCSLFERFERSIQIDFSYIEISGVRNFIGGFLEIITDFCEKRKSAIIKDGTYWEKSLLPTVSSYVGDLKFLKNKTIKIVVKNQKSVLVGVALLLMKDILDDFVADEKQNIQLKLIKNSSYLKDVVLKVGLKIKQLTK